MALFANAPSYGSNQTLALQAPQFNLATPLKDAASITSDNLQNDRFAQMTPLMAASQGLQNQTSALALATRQQLDPIEVANAQRAKQQQDQNWQDTQIARAAALIDPNAPDAPDQWNEAMGKLADGGVTAAKQYVGRYNSAVRDQVVNAYGAQSPLAAAAGVAQGGQPQAPAGDAGQFDQLFNGKTPAELRTTQSQLQPLVEAAHAVLSSSDPVAEWNRRAKALGHDDWANETNPLRAITNAKRLIAADEPLNNYLKGRIEQGGAGVPAPIVKPELKEAGGALYSIDPKTGKATYQAGGDWQLIGTDPATQKGVFENKSTGEQKLGSMPLGAKPGTTNGKSSVFEQRQQAWLDAHPGDNQGALDYAGGHKVLSPAEMREAANAQAARDLQAATLAGQSVPDAAGYLKQQADAHYAELAGATTTATKPAAPAAGAAQATPAQLQAARRYAGVTGAVGSKDHPAVPTSEAQYAALKPGTFYLHPDGSLRQKH